MQRYLPDTTQISLLKLLRSNYSLVRKSYLFCSVCCHAWINGAISLITYEIHFDGFLWWLRLSTLQQRERNKKCLLFSLMYCPAVLSRTCYNSLSLSPQNTIILILISALKFTRQIWAILFSANTDSTTLSFQQEPHLPSVIPWTRYSLLTSSSTARGESSWCSCYCVYGWVCYCVFGFVHAESRVQSVMCVWDSYCRATLS